MVRPLAYLPGYLHRKKQIKHRPNLNEQQHHNLSAQRKVSSGIHHGESHQANGTHRRERSLPKGQCLEALAHGVPSRTVPSPISSA